METVKKKENIDQIVFFDSEGNLDELKTIIAKEKLLIFTFNIESHKILAENKIEHKISDIYLTIEDLQYIQKKSYEYSKWSQNENVLEYITYNGINLGDLSYDEFNYNLVSFLKKIVEIKRIFENYRDSRYFVSESNFGIITLFTNKVQKFNSNTKMKNNFLYDSIKLSFTIFNRSLSISISRKTYQKIKTITDNFINFLLKFRKRCVYNKKSVLLVECDITRFESLISKKSKTHLNLTIYNRRRPIVWNLKSFSTLYNSNCHLINSKDLTDLEIEKKIKTDQNEFVSKFEDLLKVNDFFYMFFSIDEVQFWDTIKTEFIKLYKKRMLEAIYEINIAKKMFERNNFSSVLIWSESGFNEQIIIKLAKKYGIIINLIQHGMYYDTEEARNYNEFNGVFPIYSDNFLSWGEVTENYVKSCGFMKKIFKVGSPFYDLTFRNKKMTRKGDYVLLTTTSPGKNIAADLTISTIQRYENTIKTICKIVSQMNKKLIVKMHPFQDERDISDIVKGIDKSIKLIKTGDSLSLISSSIVVISIDMSTTILEAQILEKPVISVPTKNQCLGNPEIFKSNACLTVRLDDLGEILTKIISNSEFEDKLVKNGVEFVKRYLSNPGNSAESILNFLNQN